MTSKSYELHLPYFKQGDDLGYCLEHAKSNGVSNADAEAFTAYAELLRSAADTLDRMSELASDQGLEIEHADAHFIQVVCDEELGEALCKEGILNKLECEDEDEIDEEGLDEEAFEEE